MKPKSTSKQSNIPWLIKIQQESWQAEIFLSGILIFTLTKIPQFVTNKFYIIGSQYIDFNDIRAFEYLIRVSVYWLIVGFVVHLILRGIWAGFVGLSYTFPNGIIKEQTNFAPKFQRVIDNIPTPEQSIIALEKYCSALFSITFMLFMITLGITVFNLFFNYLFVLLLIKIGIFNTIPAIILNAIFAIFVILYAIDFLTVGMLKKIKWLAPIYYPVYWFLNLFTLSFLYRNIYYTIATNFSRTKVIIAILIYLAAINFFAIVVIRGTPRLAYFDYRIESFMTNRNYENLRNEEDFIKNASIQSDIIDDNIVRLFIVYKLHVDEALDNCITEKEFESLDEKVLRDKKLSCLDEFYVIKIDNTYFQKLSWRYYIHPKTSEYGLITWIDISAFDKGQHEINISLKKAPRFSHKNFVYANIPFYKSK